MSFVKKLQMSSDEFKAALREAGFGAAQGWIVDVSGKCPGFATLPSFNKGVVNRNATLSKAIWERDAEIRRLRSAANRPAASPKCHRRRHRHGAADQGGDVETCRGVLSSREAGLCTLRNQSALLLGQRGVEVEDERVYVRAKLGDDKGHLERHEPRDEMAGQRDFRSPRQRRDVEGDAARLVAGEHLGSSSKFCRRCREPRREFRSQFDSRTAPLATP
jgi:hypothetical protein